MPKTRKNTGDPKPPKTEGFGFDPADPGSYYELCFDRSGAALYLMRDGRATEKARLDLTRWAVIQQPARAALNLTLQKYGYPLGRFSARKPTRLGRTYGKELLLLMWAVEPPQPIEQVERAVQSWAGLHPEERWWLCTTTDAVSDQPGFGPTRGWRLAIKYALGETGREGA